jgi:predicted AAA+ superfamily ATPase
VKEAGDFAVVRRRLRAYPAVALVGPRQSGKTTLARALGDATGRFRRWQRDYLTLLAQRDLPAWGLPAKPRVTLRLLRMLAAVNGQTWNATQIGQSLVLSYHTVNSR